MIDFTISVETRCLLAAENHALARWPAETMPIHRTIANALNRLFEPLGVDTNNLRLRVYRRLRRKGGKHKGKTSAIDLRVRASLPADDERYLRATFARGRLPKAFAVAVEGYMALSFREEGDLVQVSAYLPRSLVREAARVGREVAPPQGDPVQKAIWLAATIGLPRIMQPREPTETDTDPELN